MPRDLNLFSPHRNFRDPGAGADPEPALTASPENQNPTPRPGEEQDEGASSYRFNIYRDASEDREMQLSNNLRRGDAKDKLHPYVQTLQIEDLDSCLALENAAFPEHERCTREKFIYRLTTCPELSLGLFSSTTITPTTENQASHDAARAPDSHTPSHRAVLLAQVVATLTTAPTITDASMAIPTNLPAHSDHVAGGSSPSQTYSNQAPHSSSHPCSSHAPSKLLSYLTNALAALDVPAPERLNGETSQSPSDVDASVGQVDGDPSKITALRKQYLRKINRIAAAKKLRPPPYQELDPMPGHHPQGRTLAIHSVCVLPGYQHLGLGKILVKAYLQRMETSGIADRIVLLARPDLVGWYTGSFGFQDKGDSEAKFGGGGWRDMVYNVAYHGAG